TEVLSGRFSEMYLFVLLKTPATAQRVAVTGEKQEIGCLQRFVSRAQSLAMPLCLLGKFASSPRDRNQRPKADW
ncbi:MAG: hypothetical protein ACON4H_00095, partial [Rubripirellula sp.]